MIHPVQVFFQFKAQANNSIISEFIRIGDKVDQDLPQPISVGVDHLGDFRVYFTVKGIVFLL